MGRKRRQRQQLIFQQQRPDKQEQQIEEIKIVTQKVKLNIIIRKPVCIKENRVKAIHKMQHGIWINRARRRFRKANYFSERA